MNIFISLAPGSGFDLQALRMGNLYGEILLHLHRQQQQNGNHDMNSSVFSGTMIL